MKSEDELIRIFTGSEVSALLLKDELEEAGIPAMVQNDYQSGLMAGFVGGTPAAVDVYINEMDMGKAEPVIDDFMKKNG
jgi:hypothetical protein